eukprot:jgi/Tetstr1/453363/TSEL_040353.t1
MAEQVRALLQQGHAKLESGDVGGALQCVATALTAVGGSGALMPAIQAAIERWNAGVRSRADVDDLTHLLSSISLLAPQPADHHAAGGPAPMAEDQAALPPPALTPPILAETGREGITQCAMDDGSSYMCRACGGLVPRGRQEHHDRFWCQPPS